MQGADLVETPTWLAIFKVNKGKWLLTLVFNLDLLFQFHCTLVTSFVLQMILMKKLEAKLPKYLF